jgi:predicted outer membrane repeat protein
MNKYLITSFVLAFTVSVLFLAGCGNPTGGGGGGGTSAFSADIYVSNTGSDDSGTGSSSKPFKTIQHALNVCDSHDVIGLFNGIYKEHLRWPTPEAVCLKGQSQLGAIISGEGTGRCITIDSTAAANQTITMESLTIINGHSALNEGGGINIYQAGILLHLKNVSMTDNSVGTTLSGGAVNGGYASDVLVAENCSFEGNSATYGGAISMGGASSLTADNCSFIDNTAAGYGAIRTGYITLDACTFTGNSAVNLSGGAEDGAIYVYGGGSITNCLFFNNMAEAGVGVAWAGAIRHVDNAGYPNAKLYIVNCTFASNEASSSGSTATYGAIYGYPSTMVINCILWGNIAATAHPQLNDDACAVSYCDVQGGSLGTNSVSVEPVFAGPFPYTSVNSLKLTSGSPATVTRGGTSEGAPSVDYSGAARTIPYSIGAYEKN